MFNIIKLNRFAIFFMVVLFFGLSAVAENDTNNGSNEQASQVVPVKKIRIPKVTTTKNSSGIPQSNNRGTAVPLPLPPAQNNTIPAVPLNQNQMALPQKGLPKGISQKDMMKMLQQQMGQAGGAKKSLKEQLGDEKIDDIHNPVHIFTIWEIIPYIVGAIIVAILIYLIIRKLTRPKQIIIRKPHEIAFDELTRIKKSMDNETSRNFSILVSNAIRVYIENRFNVTSTSSTTDEFMELVRNNDITGLKEHMDLLHKFLEFCDLAKFAGREFSKEQKHGMLDSAWTFVEETKFDDTQESSKAEDGAEESTDIEPDVVPKGGAA